MFTWFNWFNRFTGDYCLEDEHETLFERIIDLEERVLKLEEDNIELTNCLYEVENRIQAKIDSIHPVVYNLKDYTLDK
jgi:formyltetrahydrofolate synthetase